MKKENTVTKANKTCGCSDHLTCSVKKELTVKMCQNIIKDLEGNTADFYHSFLISKNYFLCVFFSNCHILSLLLFQGYDCCPSGFACVEGRSYYCWSGLLGQFYATHLNFQMNYGNKFKTEPQMYDHFNNGNMDFLYASFWFGIISNKLHIFSFCCMSFIEVLLYH